MPRGEEGRLSGSQKAVFLLGTLVLLGVQLRCQEQDPGSESPSLSSSCGSCLFWTTTSSDHDRPSEERRGVGFHRVAVQHGHHARRHHRGEAPWTDSHDVTPARPLPGAAFPDMTVLGVTALSCPPRPPESQSSTAASWWRTSAMPQAASPPPCPGSSPQAQDRTPWRRASRPRCTGAVPRSPLRAPVSEHSGQSSRDFVDEASGPIPRGGPGLSPGSQAMQ